MTPEDGVGDRDESADERHDRNWIELLNELRVAQTGVQVMAGFLLTLPFTERFTRVDHRWQVVHLVAFGLAGVTTLLIVAPTTLHRALYARHQKGALVRLSNRLAQAGLVSMAATFVAVAVLIFGVVGGTTAGVVAGVVTAVLAALLWWEVPRRTRNA